MAARPGWAQGFLLSRSRRIESAETAADDTDGRLSIHVSPACSSRFFPLKTEGHELIVPTERRPEDQ